MKIYMYNEEEAKKNNCISTGNPAKTVLTFLGLFMLLLFAAIFLSAFFISDSFIIKLLSFAPWIGLIIFTIVYIKYILKVTKSKNWPSQTAFIKEGDTLWAVKLTYIHYAEPVVNASTATTLISLPGAINSAKEEKELHEEMQERKINQDCYKEALIDAKLEENIMTDIDKNFNFVFNGREAVIRLDDIKFVSETATTELYTYKNYKGETTNFEIVKAYPGLRDEVNATPSVKHKFPFPKSPVPKVRSNPFYGFLILMGIFVGIPILYLIIEYLFN